jgi:Phage conserved hypothetical protein BR0599
MKRLMPAGLIAFLQNNPNCTKADLFQIALPTGAVMNVTEGQFDITVPSGTAGWAGSTTTFSATQYGRWNRGPITSEANFGLPDNPMALTCIPQQGTVFPGLTIGILNAALNGLFEPSSVRVWTAYMPNGAYGNVSNGIETKWFGYIGKINNIDRTKVEFACVSPLYLCDTKIPTTLFTSQCQNNFCDSNCTRIAANYTVAFTAATGSNQNTLTPVTAFTQPAGYFAQGAIRCTAGANAGLSQAVASHDGSGNLQMLAPWLLPIAAGDTFSVIKGCDKSMGMCASTLMANGSSDGINWQLIFRGYPYIPPSSSVVG